MKLYTSVLLVSVLFIGVSGQKVRAQYASSIPARELLQELQDAKSATKVGISWLDYGNVARNIQIKLDRFLRAPGADKHPFGHNLQETAKTYLGAYNGESAAYWFPVLAWQQAATKLRTTEECIASPTTYVCDSIASFNKREARENEIYKFVTAKNNLYPTLLQSVSISSDSSFMLVYVTKSFVELPRNEQNLIAQKVLKDTKVFLQKKNAFVKLYDPEYKELFTVK